MKTCSWGSKGWYSKGCQEEVVPGYTLHNLRRRFCKKHAQRAEMMIAAFSLGSLTAFGGWVYFMSRVL